MESKEITGNTVKNPSQWAQGQSYLRQLYRERESSREPARPDASKRRIEESGEGSSLEESADGNRPDAFKRRRIIEESGEGSSLTDTHIQGWRGSPDQTLTALLQKITQGADLSRYKGDKNRENVLKRLKNVIYRMYVDNIKQTGFSNKTSDEAYRTSLNDIECPEGMKSGYLGYGYLHFEKIHFRYRSKDWRFSLNVQPDHIVQATNLILQNIARLDYVAEVKVVSKSVEGVERRLDNVVIFFHEPAGDINRNKLAELLRPYAKYTRDGHPAMMMPLEGIDGIAFGEQTIDRTNWGEPRAKAIAEALMNLESLEVDPQILLQKVRERFDAHGIDPEHLYRNKRE